MTPNQAREWMIQNWDADEAGTDLDGDRLDAAFYALLGRYPDAKEDAFGILKNLLLPTLTNGEAAEILTQTNQ